MHIRDGIRDCFNGSDLHGVSKVRRLQIGRLSRCSRSSAASRAKVKNEASNGLSLPVRHAVLNPTVTVSDNGRMTIEEFNGKDCEPGTKATPNPAPTRAMSVDVSVASCTMRGRNPAWRVS